MAALKPIDWKSMFQKRRRARGASETPIRMLQGSISAPLTMYDRVALKAKSKWTLPSGPLPRRYLDLLRWPNGGEFWNGHRCFQFLRADKVRETLLWNCVPKYMPGSLPFALDGGGHFYLFDMRKAPVRGEYPILYVGCGNLGYEDAIVAAMSFLRLCRGTTDLVDRYLDQVVKVTSGG